MINRFKQVAYKLNHSPVWNHSMLCVFLYALEMIWLLSIEIYRYFNSGYSKGVLKAWLLMTIPLILVWLLLGLRNYYINKKIGIWKHYQKKTRKGKLID